MGNNPLVSIIIVSYGDANLTLQLLTSLNKISYTKTEIIIIDNHEYEDISSSFQEKSPKVRVIKTKANRGYAAGINIGIRHAKGEYLLLLNNDLEVDTGFLEPMVDTFDKYTDAGIISPKVLFYKTGKIQYAGTGKINFFTGRGFTENHNQDDTKELHKTFITSYAFGAVMMVPGKLVRKVGTMPEIYFMYYEELDWSEKFKRAGYKVYCVGESLVYHKDDPAPEKYSYLKNYYLFRNRILFLRRNTNFFANIVALVYIGVFVYFYKSIRGLFRGNKGLVKANTRALLWNLTHYKISDP